MTTYKHPQGKVIVVHENGTMTCTKNGKPATSSATPEKLEAGYGGWVVVADANEPAPAMPQAPVSSKPFALRPPMRFQQADRATLMKAVTNDLWLFQQKLDGNRAQVVVTREDVWARASSGDPLKSTAAGPVARKVIDSITGHRHELDDRTFVLDGEIVGGEWWMFDMLDGDDHDRTPYRERLDRLDTYLRNQFGLSPLVRKLPTARTTDEKAALLKQVIQGGGEGVLLKRIDAGYTYGARVTHSLKFKITHTVDAVVMDRDCDGREQNAKLGLFPLDGGKLVEIGSTSMIGKPDAQVGEVLEVRYLYAGAGGRLVQPTVLRKRTDKAGALCTIDQLVFVNKDVIEELPS